MGTTKATVCVGRRWSRAALFLLLLLCASTAQKEPRLRMRGGAPLSASISRRVYLMPSAWVELVRRNRNSSEERRELQQRMRSLKADCSASTAIGEDELATIKVSGPVTPEGKCFLGCMMEGMAIIEDGKFAFAPAEALVRRVYAEGSKRKSALSALRACQKEVTTTERCETGALVFACFRRHKLFGRGA